MNTTNLQNKAAQAVTHLPRIGLLNRKATVGICAFALPVALMLSGCGAMQGKAEVQTTVDDASARAKAFSDKAATHSAADFAANQVKQQEVHAPWLAGKSVPLAKEVTQPAILNQRITALTPECNPSNYTINRLAACVTALIGQPVRVMPDALLPQSLFTMRQDNAATGQTGSGASAKAGDTLAVAPVNMKLSDLLDTAAAAWAIKYRVAEDGGIELYRMQTRVLRLKALSQKITHTDTQSTGFNTESKTTFENTPSDVVIGMRTTLLALGTNAGSLDVNTDSKSVIVTDTPEAIARIEAYIDSENKRLNRRIKITVEELLVTNKRDREASVNWSALYNQLDGIISVSSPASLTSANAGAMGFKPSASQAAGSSLLINALDEMGLNALQRTVVRTTLSGNPISLQDTTLFDYVPSITNNSVTGTTGTVSAPTITSQSDRYGTFLTVTPEAQDDGQVVLSIVTSDRSVTLTPYKVEIQGSSTTVQQRTIPENINSGRTVVRAGVPHLFSLYEEKQSASTGRRLDESAPLVLGGSDVATQSKRHIFLVITAVVEDNI